MALSPDGAHLYVASSNTIEVYDRDAATGELDRHLPVNFLFMGWTANDVAVSPDGAHVYTSAGTSLYVLDRDAGTGDLAVAALYEDVAGPQQFVRSLAVSPDGLNVYLVTQAGTACAAVHAFSRDGISGALNGVDSDELDPVICDGERALAVSLDGLNVYVPAQYGIEVFARAAATGALTSQQVLYPSHVAGGADLAVSADGANVYVATNTSNRTLCLSVAPCPTPQPTALTRDAGTGELTFLADYEHLRSRRVAVDAAGAIVLFANDRGELTLYDRNALDGTLALNDRVHTEALDSWGLAVSPDDRHAYLNTRDKGLQVFALTCGDGVTDSGETCDDGNSSAGDGCSRVCAVEQCWSCSGSPSSCVTANEGGACNDADACSRSDVCTAGVCAGVAQPEPTCRDAGAAKLTLSEGSRQKLVWKWSRGAATTLEEFGNPLATTDYALCVYDDSARPQPLIALDPPRKCGSSDEVCWKALGDKGFAYSDRQGFGLLRSISLRPGPDGRASIKLKGTTFGPGVGESEVFPMTLDVTVQFHSSEGVCWQSTHTTATKNTDSKFSAK